MLTFQQFIKEHSDDHPSGIEGLPAHVKLDHPSFWQLHHAMKRGGFKMKATEVKDRYGDHQGYDVDVHPNDVPKHWKQTKRGAHYDPKHFNVDEYGSLKPKSRGKLFNRPEGHEHGFLHRGMSHEEYKNALKHGHIKSHGDYNFEGQDGLTYYSKAKEQAANYANGFAPWHQKATPSRPAVMVKVKDPGKEHHVHHEGEGEDEVGLHGKMHTKHIAGVHFGHAVAVHPGYFRILHHPYDQHKYQMGSSSGMSTDVHWTSERKPHHT